MEFGGKLDNYLCRGAEEAMFGGGPCECQMCGKVISESDAEENYGLCETCLCNIDGHACELCGAPVELILDRLKEYLGEYEITIVKRVKSCDKCKHNGCQSLYPSGCTGCGAHDEFKNFEPKDTPCK